MMNEDGRHIKQIQQNMGVTQEHQQGHGVYGLKDIYKETS
jgi:hypothetical protein